ncbi:hypothetical protein BOTBODRAFT_188297 [Botryobasidium botryosum FD-172 SS1]|uniref:Heat shock 70 kDa protein 12A n=1 Tax=Botryobasidium botryosum (strain FD-172 SS1) TaxID=930990 RepID=A0A067MQI9_BOTB1|nr:hypothetical protein BOTBODRAFT_188297 [Botryobasidium botryosum FD-172 SS1]
MVAVNSFFNEKWQKEAIVVVAMDIGTTQTAVSFAYFYKDGPQTIRRVNQWPGQESQAGCSKIPSLVWYDKTGRARAFGAEVHSCAMKHQADEEGWKMATHFKLHAHPTSMRTRDKIKLDPLPFDVPLEKIYSDFMRYLCDQTRQFFQRRIINGEKIWRKLESSLQFIIAHPNGWGISEQTLLRRAAVSAGLVPPNLASRERIRFITEREASVHFVLVNTDLQKHMKPGVELLVCDPDGSTVDTSLYTVVDVNPVLSFQEVRTSACVQAGAILVSRSAEKYFSRRFNSAKLDPDDVEAYIEEAMECFENDIKKSFRDPSKDYPIKVGDRKFNDKKLGVRKGYMTLKGSQIQLFFAPWVVQVIESVEQQIEGHAVRYILLVGDFADSPYLRSMLKAGPGERGIEIILANNSAAKTDGGVIWYARHAVGSRATRFAYGTETLVDYDPKASEHQGRQVRRTPGGATVKGGWSQVIGKGEVLDEEVRVSKAYYRMFSTAKPSLSTIEEIIYSYDGPEASPKFMYNESGEISPHFHKTCVVRADLTGKHSALIKMADQKGAYWRLRFEVALTFVSTELRAAIEWKENGQTCRGPITIVPLI